MFLASLHLLACVFSTVTAQYARQNANETITFDNTCSETQKGVVIKALQDAFSMAELVSLQTQGGVNDGPAFTDLFGPSANDNESVVDPMFTNFICGDWKISASCDLTNASPFCTDRYLHGEIGAKFIKPFGPKFVFCKEFWGLTPLEIQIHKAIQQPVAHAARFDLGLHRDNHATSVLRQMFQHTHQEDRLQITQLWVLLPYHDGRSRWTACQGAYCARLLAV
jgi:hypothetical protein